MISPGRVAAIVVFIFLVILSGADIIFCYERKGGSVLETVMVDERTASFFMLEVKHYRRQHFFSSNCFYYVPSIIGVILLSVLYQPLFPSADGALTALTSS